jgi:hypothetical protein
MRWKIILVNGGIVLVISLVTFFLLKTSLASKVADPKAQRAALVQAIHAAEARLTLDSLMSERWLARQANSDEVRAVFEAGTKDARSDSATSFANQLRDRAVASPEFVGMSPTLFLFVDTEGVGVGRNGSELMRGDKVAEAYPSLGAALQAGNTASALWVNQKRQEQLVASFAPVRSTSGELLGGIIIGTPLNDERMSRISEFTSGRSIGVVVGDGQHPVAAGGGQTESFASSAAAAAIAGARAGNLTHAPTPVEGALVAAAPLVEFSGSKAVLVGASPLSLVANLEGVLWPIFAVGGLGLFLVIVGGVLLGNYISRPISEVEEGLLLVINGQRDLRFDLEHDELGGLTSGINGLLNSILGVPEGEEGGES